MIGELFKKEEKKVEYIELIYDLIFVYIIGRNNSLLSSVENGFIPGSVYLTYFLTTLIALHIWYLTTVFINRYGSKSVAEYIGIFINMYLLYYMADGTRVAWQSYYTKYNIAWGLILVNLAVQYFIKLRQAEKLTPWVTAHIKFSMGMLLGEAVIVFASVPLFSLTGIPLSPLALLFVLLPLFLRRDLSRLMSVDFAHLTERVMLYVVFTFGEMIISISGYFSGGFNLRSTYFSLMAFLIVAGLFLIYGYFYDHIIDREQDASGTGYMLLHIFLITALNNISVALEFMREPEVDAVPKTIFLVASFVVYYIFLFSLEKYAYCCKKPSAKFWALIIGVSVLFAALIALSYNMSDLSIAITVCYIYSMFAISVIHSRLHRRKVGEDDRR